MEPRQDKQLVVANAIPPAVGMAATAGWGHPVQVFLDHIVSRYPDFPGVTYFLDGDLRPEFCARLERMSPHTANLAPATLEVSLTPLPYGPLLAITTANVGGCTSTVTALAWKAIFAEEPPMTIRAPLRPAFAVTGSRLLERSHAFYQHLQEETALGDLITPKAVQALWPYIFGNPRRYPSWR